MGDHVYLLSQRLAVLDKRGNRNRAALLRYGRQHDALASLARRCLARSKRRRNAEVNSYPVARSLEQIGLVNRLRLPTSQTPSGR